MSEKPDLKTLERRYALHRMFVPVRLIAAKERCSEQQVYVSIRKAIHLQAAHDNAEEAVFHLCLDKLRTAPFSLEGIANG
jgi:hypothetical protein